MSGALAATMLATWLVALPPPLCRGKTAARYDPKQNRTPHSRAVAEIRAAYAELCPLVSNEGVCGTGDIYENHTIGNNAVTWVSGLGEGKNTRALIVYSARFLEGLEQSFGPGASFGVLAHEVGHHLTAAGNLRKRFDHAWDEELRADFFAGCALASAGHAPDALENALRALASVATPTHPSFAHRTTKVRKGYGACQKRQDAKDRVKAQKRRFGIGALVREANGELGCWGYFFRRETEVKTDGPLAAPRRRSRDYPSKTACEAARRDALGEKAEPCLCVR